MRNLLFWAKQTKSKLSLNPMECQKYKYCCRERQLRRLEKINCNLELRSYRLTSSFTVENLQNSIDLKCSTTVQWTPLLSATYRCANTLPCWVHNEANMAAVRHCRRPPSSRRNCSDSCVCKKMLSFVHHLHRLHSHKTVPFVRYSIFDPLQLFAITIYVCSPNTQLLWPVAFHRYKYNI